MAIMNGETAFNHPTSEITRY